MTTFIVYYPKTEGGRFDADYYVAHHLPLVREAWGPAGLERIDAFFPADDQAEIIAMAICRFPDDAALEAAFAAPRTPEVMADVAKYTDIPPLRGRLGPF